MDLLSYLTGLASTLPLAVGALWLAARIGDLLPDDDSLAGFKGA